MISSLLHFSNVEEFIPRGQPGYKPLQKIQRLMDLLAPRISQAFYPYRSISLDESMAPFKGRCHFRMYMPNKPTKRGFKVFLVCDATTHYAMIFVVYTGKEDFTVPADTSFTEHLVTTLMTDYFDASHVLYMDCFCSSPSLFLSLQDKQTGAVGTVMENRRGFPDALKRANQPLRKGDDPVFYRHKDLVAVAWHDTKRVHLLSTIHTNTVVDKEIRNKDDPTGYRRVKKPVIADVYNAHMGGVDYFDKKLKNYYYPHRNYKWYMALFNYFKEMCLVNSHNVYEQDGHKGTVKDFHREIVTGLVQPYMASQPTQSPNANAMGRLAVAAFGHFPAQFEDKKHRPNCKVCSLVKVHAQTRFYCPVCNVALCVSTCFRIYHTAENIRAAREQVNP